VSLWDFKPESKIALIAGNEVLGVSKVLRDKADVIVEIPMLGARKSLNVSVAYGIATFFMRAHAGAHSAVRSLNQQRPNNQTGPSSPIASQKAK